jgi:hypothetical protein
LDFPFVFLNDIGKFPAATRSLIYAIRGQWTVDADKSDVVFSILLENLGRLSVRLLRTVAVPSEVSARCLILDYLSSWFHRSAFLKNPASVPGREPWVWVNKYLSCGVDMP